MSRVPAHARIRADLENAIRSGELPSGASVPTERELAERYGVSRSTVQRALTDMAQAGLVNRRRRAGTVVAGGGAAANLLRFTDLVARGPEIEGAHRVLDALVLPADDLDEQLPGVGPDEPVIHLRRVKDDAEGVPAAVESAIIPFSVAPRLLQEDLAPLTTLAYFHRIGVPVSRSRLYISPVVAGPEESSALRVEPGAALLHLRRETYLRGGGLAELFTCALSPHAFRLFIEQSVESEQFHAEEGR
ncbi:GntR family transcriptional regulator [Saccharopolyspora cebuensis]|uniref:GntR family transcriptional regulator n=1 Tax=Saccharopolyspora cebuensis TaxID=418759 RepID=A0ABV4CJB0_9PSEU